MLPRPVLWFVGALIVFDLLAAFLSSFPASPAIASLPPLKDILSYRAAGLIEGNDKLVLAAGTIAIAAFTYTLWRSTERLWRAGEQQIALAQSTAETTRQALDHTRTAERAYVKMSHVAPGLVFETDGTVRVTVQTKNFGRTPANVTDVILTPFVLRPGMTLPERPPYQGTQGHLSAGAFLMTNDRVLTYATFQLPDFQQVLLGQLPLYLFGYVDYVDAFGQRQRGGYARLFMPEQKENNLVFVTTNASYNYDVSRQPGEGKDWSQSFA